MAEQGQDAGLRTPKDQNLKPQTPGQRRGGLFGFFGGKKNVPPSPSPQSPAAAQAELTPLSPIAPIETTPPTPENALDQLPQVSIGGNRLGRELKEQGERISMKHIFGSDKTQPSTREVYFRTGSGNIYHLEKTENGFKLRNANGLAKPPAYRGAMPPEQLLEWEEQVGNELAVGKSFLLDSKFSREVGGGGTTPIAEIVVVDKELALDKNFLNTLSPNPIIEDFENIAMQGKIEQKPPQMSSEAILKMQGGLKRFLDSPASSEIFNVFKNDNRVEFFRQIIPYLRITVPGINSDEIRQVMSMTIASKLVMDPDFRDKPQEIDKKGNELNLSMRQAQILATKFEGNEGLDIYIGLVEAVGSKNYQDYLKIMMETDASPAIKEVAKEVILNLFIDGKFEELDNLSKMDSPLVEEALGELVEKLREK